MEVRATGRRSFITTGCGIFDIGVISDVFHSNETLHWFREA